MSKEDVHITMPKRLIDKLLYYYYTTNGLYVTDLKEEAIKMKPETFWHLEDDDLQKTVEEIEKYLKK